MKGDEDKTFDVVFADCMYSCIKESGIYLSLIQLQKFQKASNIAGKRLERKVNQTAREACKYLQDGTKKGFELVAEDITELTDKVNDLKNNSPQVKSRSKPKPPPGSAP